MTGLYEQARARGTNTSNPNQGRLAGQLEASKSSKRQPELKQEEQLVVSAFRH
jgi:hypothetical protein